MNKISSRQLYFFLAAVAPVGKLVLLPVTLAHYAANDLLFSAAANFLLQAGVIALVLLLAKNGLSLGELLQKTFGKVGAKIILTVFSAFFFYAALCPLIEQKLFVQSIFYDTLPSVITFSSFFLFSAYLCAKPLSSYGRSWDILAPVAIVGFIGIIALSAGSADFGALKPVGAAGIGGITRGAAYTTYWFFDSAILLTLLGKIEYKRGMAWKGPLFYLAGATAVLLFLAVFYGIFSEIAVRQQFAFAKIGKYSPAVGMLGRIDYLFVFAIALAMAFYSALPLQAGVDCLRQAYGSPAGKLLPALISVAVNIVMLALTVFFDYQFAEVRRVVGEMLFWIFPVFTVLLPALSPLLKLRIRKREGKTA